LDAQVSSVLYLGDVGGPTAIFNQTFDAYGTVRRRDTMEGHIFIVYNIICHRPL
jgi:hypothetical protein